VPCMAEGGGGHAWALMSLIIITHLCRLKVPNIESRKITLAVTKMFLLCPYSNWSLCIYDAIKTMYASYVWLSWSSFVIQLPLIMLLLLALCFELYCLLTDIYRFISYNKIYFLSFVLFFSLSNKYIFHSRYITFNIWFSGTLCLHFIY
jgi:hypothetical protein